MDVGSVCTSLLAESDTPSNTTSTPNAASVTDADKVINTKIDSTQVEEDKSEEELLKSLLADDYCHVCDAVLLFESQRLSHYEGKKHTQKIKLFLQAKRAEKMKKHPSELQQTMPADKDRFCELCNMVFSSPVVAKSHYEGKVHSKNLRKQGLQPTVVDRNPGASTLPCPTGDPDNANQKSAADDAVEHLQSPAVTSTASTLVDLKDPNKYCALCAASLHNPQMALQHYNGRKHQRNQTRQDLLRALGDDVQQEKSLMCQMCSVQFNSVEMYQAHMQGNKHQIREKKVIDLCKSQQKDYDTFADELSDYIQVQRARGLAPKTSQVLSSGDARNEDDEDEEGLLHKGGILKLKYPVPKHSRPGCYHPGEGWYPPFQAPPQPYHDWHYNSPPPVFPDLGSAHLTGLPVNRKRHTKRSNSSSYDSSSSYSSYSSSYSSSTSDGDDRAYRQSGKRIKRSRKERNKRAKDEYSDKEDRRRKQQRKESDKESKARRKGESGSSEEERRRKKKRNHCKQGKRALRSQEEDLERKGRVKPTEEIIPEAILDNRKVGEANVKTDAEQGDGGQDKHATPKCRKEKRKTKGKEDNRTEEEKLWDDSILGC